MDLSPEQKQRILDEETQRIAAEEQYRNQIREQLAAKASASKTPSAEIVKPPERSNRLPLVIGLCVVALIVIGGVIFKVQNSSTTSDITSTKAPAMPVKLTTAQIAAKATPAVVVVENFNEDGVKASQGSGYLYSDDGIVVTNYHVIRGASSLSITVPSTGKARVENVLGYSPETDVAIIQLPQRVTASLETEGAQSAKVGDHVVAIGAPLGLESTVSEGIISALRDAGGIHLIQTTASISPGSSGGPLLNDYGKVIGLTTAKVQNGENLNLVLSSTHINDLVSRKRDIPLSKMLTETLVSDHIATNTLSVPARNIVTLSFVVRSEQGALLDGSYSVSGGSGNDVGVVLLTNDNKVLVNSGIVKSEGQLRQRLPRGSYLIMFDNRFSTFTSKSVSPNFTLAYYR
jgi:S1-C subfamily serine protease